MEISVVIPAYNVESVLKDAVESVLKQTYIQYIKEIIIINDGSKDKTLQVMRNIKEEINRIPIVLLDQKNKGASAARNAGLKIAKGDWIALLDADDEWLPNKLEKQILAMKEQPDIDFIGCSSDDLELHLLWKKVNGLYKASIKDLCIKSFPVTPSILFRKEILNTIGYFDETKKYMEDNDFCLRICEHFNYYYLAESLVITGHGKSAIGETGLSSNIKGMYLGRVRNMKELYARRSISFPFYMFCCVFNFMKYILRRYVLS